MNDHWESLGALRVLASASAMLAPARLRFTKQVLQFQQEHLLTKLALKLFTNRTMVRTATTNTATATTTSC